MAKSLRSKWRRKMKVLKRVRYGKKELDQLKNIVEKAKENDAKISDDVPMVDDHPLYKVVTRPSRRSGVETKEDEIGPDKMETDGKLRIFNPHTLRDQDGHYPVWMSSHKIKRLQALNKKQKKEKVKEAKRKKKTRKQ